MTRWLIAAAAAAAIALATRRSSAGQGGAPFLLPDGWQQLDDPDQTPSTVESALIMLTPSTYSTSPDDQAQAERNERAFLDAIAWAEGTARAPGGGYGVLFGWPLPGREFAPEWAVDHPRILFDYTDKAGRAIKTSAAGRYQITRTTFDQLRAKYPDRFEGAGFGPAVQDHMALTLIEERGALADVRAGRFADAVAKVRRVWASLPGSGNDQPERPFDQLLAAYRMAGGTVEA